MPNKYKKIIIIKNIKVKFAKRVTNKKLFKYGDI